MFLSRLLVLKITESFPHGCLRALLSFSLCFFLIAGVVLSAPADSFAADDTTAVLDSLGRKTNNQANVLTMLAYLNGGTSSFTGSTTNLFNKVSQARDFLNTINTKVSAVDSLHTLSSTQLTSLYNSLTNHNSVGNVAYYLWNMDDNISDVSSLLSTINGKLASSISLSGVESFLSSIDSKLAYDLISVAQYLELIDSDTNDILDFISDDNLGFSAFVDGFDNLSSQLGTVNSRLFYNSKSAARYLSDTYSSLVSDLVPDLSSVADDTDYIASHLLDLTVSNFNRISLTKHNDYSPFRSLALPTPLQTYYPLLISAYTYTDSDGRSRYAYGYNQQSPSVSSLGDWLNLLNTNLVQSYNAVSSFDTRYESYVFDSSSFSLAAHPANSLMDILSVANFDISSSLGRLSYFLVDQDDIDSKLDNADLTAVARDAFLSPGSAAALDVSDVLRLSNGVSYLQNGFYTGTNPNLAFDIYDSDDAFGWFSNSVKSDLDSSSSAASSAASSGGLLRSSGSSTPHLDSYYRSVLGVLYNDVD